MTDAVQGSNRRLVVQKLLYDGSPSYRWVGQILEQGPDFLVFGAVMETAGRDLGYVVFECGDVFYEYYYFDRWYNVFQIYSAAGALKGWYCNVTVPAVVQDGTLTFVDLALDLFVYPDGRQLVLDEEEFEELAGTTYSPEHVVAARAALAELAELAEARALPGRPFEPLVPVPAVT